MIPNHAPFNPDHRAEDLALMADCHETVEGAAKRLGITVHGLKAWCDDNRNPSYRKLVANGAQRPAKLHRGRVLDGDRRAS